jgi:hypothetical protein
MITLLSTAAGVIAAYVFGFLKGQKDGYNEASTDYTKAVQKLYQTK